MRRETGLNGKPYFHLLDASQFEHMKAHGFTWGRVERDYDQPAWCTYPGALEGPMGCWSLVGRMVTGRDYCRTCDCYTKLQGKRYPMPGSDETEIGGES